MTLRDLQYIIKNKCLAIPNVGTFLEGDIYQLNHRQDVKYSAMCLFGQQHNLNVNDGFMRYKLILFYVDRLTDDKDNEQDIQSHAIDVLRGLITNLEYSYSIDFENVNFNTFTNRFESLCAGAYVDMTVITPISDCNDVFTPETEIRLRDITITENGTYTHEGYDGYDKVTVNVPQTGETINNQDINITENGTYQHDTGHTGLGTVVVNVPQTGQTINNQDINITENGTYQHDSGHTGLGTVTVNVPQNTFNTDDVEIDENGDYNINIGTDASGNTVNKKVSVDIECTGGTNCYNIEIEAYGDQSSTTCSGNTILYRVDTQPKNGSTNVLFDACGHPFLDMTKWVKVKFNSCVIYHYNNYWVQKPATRCLELFYNCAEVHDIGEGFPNVEKVVLGTNISYIRWGAFANSTKLTELQYQGTMTQWNAVNKASDWNYGITVDYVQCTDGKVYF